MLKVFPAWLSWLLVLTVIYLFVQVQMLVGQVRALRETARGVRPRTKAELDDWYRAGKVSRDQYEAWKADFS